MLGFRVYEWRSQVVTHSLESQRELQRKTLTREPARRQAISKPVVSFVAYLLNVHVVADLACVLREVSGLYGQR